ncbi:hypothetical protein E4U12_000679, partial [Claviceps purpurea]
APTNRGAPHYSGSQPQLPVACGAPTEPGSGAGTTRAARGLRCSHGARVRRRHNHSCPRPAVLPRSPGSVPAQPELPVACGTPTEPQPGAGTRHPPPGIRPPNKKRWK